MSQERLLIRSERDRVWRTLEPLVLIPLVLGGFRLLIGDWEGWGVWAWVVLLAALPVIRLFLWSRCPDVWDELDHLVVRRGRNLVRKVPWTDVASVHFGYHWPWPQWHVARHVPSLPAVRVNLKGQEPASVFAPGFADVLLFGKSRLAAEAALAEACDRHGVQLMSPNRPAARSIDWRSRPDSGGQG